MDFVDRRMLIADSLRKVRSAGTAAFVFLVSAAIAVAEKIRVAHAGRGRFIANFLDSRFAHGGRNRLEELFQGTFHRKVFKTKTLSDVSTAFLSDNGDGSAWILAA